MCRSCFRAQNRRGLCARRMEQQGRPGRVSLCRAVARPVCQADGDKSSPVGSSPSQHSSTSPVVKGLVSGLTKVVNLLAGVDEAAQSTAEDSRLPLSPSELLDGVEKDFTENG